jgi:hypothetical protein
MQSTVGFRPPVAELLDQIKKYFWVLDGEFPSPCISENGKDDSTYGTWPITLTNRGDFGRITSNGFWELSGVSFIVTSATAGNRHHPIGTNRRLQMSDLRVARVYNAYVLSWIRKGCRKQPLQNAFPRLSFS